MEAENDLGARGMFDPEALSAYGNAAIGADLDGGAEAPNIRPPGAARGSAQNGAFFLLGQFPSSLGCQPQFAVGFVDVSMESQSIDVRVGGLDLGDFFTGEIGREAALPELVFALDFSFCLGRWGIKEAYLVELEGPAQLGESLGIFGEKDGVIIDVDLEGTAVGEKGSGEEIEVGEEEFPVIEFGSDEDSAAIVEHIEHGKVQGAAGEPAMGRGVQLPEFADLGALPATDRCVRALGRGGMGQTVFKGPVADLGAVELEGEEPQGFRGGKAVWARWGTSQTLFKKVSDRLRPGGGVITAGSSRDPRTLFVACAGAEVIGGQSVKATARDVEFVGGIGG